MKITYSFFEILLICFLLTSSIQMFSQHKTISKEEDFYKQNIENITKQKVGSILPIIIADGIDGEIFDSEQTKKIVFYYFWYTDCGDACASQMSMLNEMQNQYKDTVDFISITYDNKPKILEFLKLHTFNFKHYMMPQNQIEIMRITHGYPTVIIVVDGIIKFWRPGGPTNLELINKRKNEYKEILNSVK